MADGMESIELEEALDRRLDRKKAEVRELLRAHTAFHPPWVRFFLGPEKGRSPETKMPVLFWPDPNAGKIIIPQDLFHSEFIDYYPGLWSKNPCNVCRLSVGEQYLIRIYWDRDKGHLRMALPADPAAEPYIIWWDWEREWEWEWDRERYEERHEAPE